MSRIENETTRKRIMIVDDEESIRFTFTHFLQEEGFDVLAAPTLAAAKKMILSSPLDLVFLDLMLGGEPGLDVLKEIKKQSLTCPVIIITGKPTLNNATDALRLGAFDFLIKPVRKDDLLHATTLAMNHKTLLDENERITLEKDRYRTNLEAIFQSVNDAIITVDEGLKVIEANQQIDTLCGIATKNMQGKPFDECLKACTAECSDVIRKTLSSKKAIKDQRIQCGRQDRPGQIVAVSSSPLVSKDKEFRGAVLVIRDMTRLNDLEAELKERSHFHNIVGLSRKIQHTFRLVEALADLDTTVLITGESGTGKELVANALHYSGKRAGRPCVKVNCAALAENLLESELFGHVKGAFTGAVKDKEGRFEMAKDGTILLDEIGEIPPRIQVKLLRVLEEKRFEKVGDSRPRKVAARVIASTNRNLRERVKQGEFREDLYYRLNIVEIELPPLRDRTEDIPLLVEHFRSMFETTYKKVVTGVDNEVMQTFMSYPWPGNVRELEHVIEHAFVVCQNATILPEHLPAYLYKPNAKATPTNDSDAHFILSILTQTDWNIAKAARMLNMSRPTLYKKIRENNLNK